MRLPEDVKRFQKAIDTIAVALGTQDGPTLIALDSVLQEDLRIAIRERSAIQDELSTGRERLEASTCVLGKSGEAAATPAPVPEAAIEDGFRQDPVMRELEANVAKSPPVTGRDRETVRGGLEPTGGRPVSRTVENRGAEEGQVPGR